jgi:uncharacterized protein
LNQRDPPMCDPGALVRVLDELLWMLRREGFNISPAQAIDAARAVAAVGLGRRWNVAEAIAAIVVQRPRDRGRFDAIFDQFFCQETVRQRRLSLPERLAARGFDETELRTLLSLFAEFTMRSDFLVLDMMLQRGAGLDFALARSDVDLDAHSGQKLGFLTHRLLSRLGAGAAHGALAALRERLLEALGLRGGALADALAQELEQTESEVRTHVRRRYDTAVSQLAHVRLRHGVSSVPFASLTNSELEEVRRAVRSFAERFRGGARVRAKRARRGRVDAHRTLLLATRSGGVPFRVSRKQSRRRRPKLIVLCDISDSVRTAARFLLEFTYAVQELFERTRSFVFVSDLGETTELFAREPVQVAIALAWGGGVVRTDDNSNYGRVLRAFEQRYARQLDRRTTLVILGDGRTNYHDPAADVLERLRERSRSVLWLCTEARGSWGQGDSAMAHYGAQCNALYEVRCRPRARRPRAALEQVSAHQALIARPSEDEPSAGFARAACSSTRDCVRPR